MGTLSSPYMAMVIIIISSPHIFHNTRRYPLTTTYDIVGSTIRVQTADNTLATVFTHVDRGVWCLFLSCFNLYERDVLVRSYETITFRALYGHVIETFTTIWNALVFYDRRWYLMTAHARGVYRWSYGEQL